MKFRYILLSIILIFLACDNTQKQTKNLDYEMSSVKTNSILVEGKLTGVVDDHQKLKLNLVLNNLLKKKLVVNEIYISTADQIKSSLPFADQKTYTISPKQDTTLSLLFYPLNDKILYENTGISGMLKSSYTVSVVYTIEGDSRNRIIDLVANVTDATYQKYKKAKHLRVQAFHINTKTQFATRLSKYLDQQKLTKNPVFVHVSDQEIAVSGLNFRFKSFQKNDSLFATIAMVNHSDFSIKIDTNQIDFKSGDINNKNPKHIVLEKISGPKNEQDIVRKGERMIISIKKYQKERTANDIFITLRNSFLLPNGRSLFLDDLELVKVYSLTN